MKKFEFDLRLCQEVPPPDGNNGGGGTGSSGNGAGNGAGNGTGNNQGAGGSDDEGKKPIQGNDDEIIEPDPLWPPIGI